MNDMNKSTIQEKLHKFLFPSHHDSIALLEKGLLEKQKEIITLREVVYQKNKLIEKLQDRPKEVRKSTISELMWEVLGDMPTDFTKADPNTGLIPHFMAMDDTDKRTVYITQLAQIYQMEAFQAMISFHINDQANFAFRSADERQITIGRASVNGISLIRNDVKTAYEEFIESHKPEEDFDKYAAGIGET